MGTHLILEVDWSHDGMWVEEAGRLLTLRGTVGFAVPGHHVAEVGHMTLEMDNFDGRYTPGSVDSPLAGKLLPRRPARIRAVSDGGEAWTIFTGWIERIEAGAESGVATITLVDAIALLRGQPLSVTYAPSRNAVECLGALVGMAYAAARTDYEGEGEVLEHVGWRWLPETMTVWDGVLDVTRTWHGRFWVSRRGEPCYRGRAWLQKGVGAVALSLGEGSGAARDVPDRLEMALDVAQVINAVQVVTYPVDTVGVQSVLWSASGILRLAPGETREIWAPFRDERGERCAAVEVVPPVPVTDYRVTEFRDASGYDYTTDGAFSLSVTIEATRARLTLRNTAIGALYVQYLRIRGKPVIEHAPVIGQAADAGSQAIYQPRATVIDLPMQADAAFGQGLAEYTVRRRAEPVAAVRRVEFRDRDVVMGANLYGLELMDQVRITDPARGLFGAHHRIHAIEYEVTPMGQRVALWLERCDDRTYWRLGHASAGVLGRGTRLGF